MARAGILDCYDITDIKGRMITADTSAGTTYGQIFDCPGAKEMSFDLELTGSESYGDGQVLDEFSRPKALSTKVDQAWLSFLQNALMLGGSSASSGSTPNEVLTTSFGPVNLPFFELQIACNYTGPNGSSTGAGIVIIHKAKLKKLSYGLKMEDRHKYGFEVRGIPLLYLEPGMDFRKLWSFVEQETISTITAAAADTTAPTVTTTVPDAAATGVVVTDPVVITFSEAMDKSSVVANGSVLLYANVAGTVISLGAPSWNAGNTIATFAVGTLAASTAYRLVITTNVRDAAGNRLATSVVRTFTTA